MEDIEEDIENISMPDKFHFDKDTETFYEMTPFGKMDVNHVSLMSFYANLKEKFGRRKDFVEIVTQLTEYRLIEPSYFVNMYNDKTLNFRYATLNAIKIDRDVLASIHAIAKYVISPTHHSLVPLEQHKTRTLISPPKKEISVA